MELLKIILISIGCMYIFYRTGVLLKKIIKSNTNHIGETLLYGVITNFALFELINIPFIFFFKNSTKIVYMIFLIMNVVFILLSYIIKRKVTNYHMANVIKKWEIPKSKKEIIFMVMAILLIAFQTYQSAFLFKEDADDSFYISWANEAKELESFYDCDPSVGIEESSFDLKYRLNTWEIYGGFVARVFQINVTTLFHTVYPMIYIILAYIAYYLVLKKTIKKENLGLAMCVMAMLFLFTGVSAKFKGPFLLGRIYQGKSILLNIILPFVVAKFLQEKELKKEDTIILIITYIAALAFTPMTISLLSLVYGLFLILKLFRKDKKGCQKIGMIMIPIMIICAIYMLQVVTGYENLERITSTEQFSQKEDFNSFLGEGKTILVLYFISMLVIAIKGTKEQKDVGVILSIIIAVVVLNPLLTNIYIKLITKETYWRLYWLLPIEITITIASVLLYEIIAEEKMKSIFVGFVVVLFVISGRYVYSEQRGFSSFQNFEKIPQYIIDETYYIASNSDKKTKVVAPPEPWESSMMRQYSTKIILIHSRNAYALENEYRSNFLNLYTAIYLSEQEEYDIAKINKLKEEYQVEWIILPKNKRLKDQEEELKYTIQTENENNYILKVI